MIGDTVAIEIPETVSDLDQGRTIGACEAALGDDSCSMLAEGAEVDWTARVTQPSLSELTIELTPLGEDDVASVRVLRFNEDEPEAFRWQSVGVVVAALVLSQNQERPRKSEPPEPPPRKSTPEPEATEKETSPPLTARGEEDVRTPASKKEAGDALTVDLAPQLTSPASGSGVGAGGWLGVAVHLRGPLHLVATGDASFSNRDEPVERLSAAAWGATLGLGLRFRFLHPDLAWDLSARGALQGLSVRAASGDDSGSAGTTRAGGRVGAALSWMPSRFIGVVGGGDLGLLWPPVDLEVGAPEAVRISALTWTGYVGVRVRLNSL